MFNPTGQAMMRLYPVSNAVNTSTLTNYANVPVRRLNEGEFDGRIDHNFSQKDTAFRPLQLRSGNIIRPWRFTRIRRAQRIRQLAGHHQPRAQCVDL